VIQWAELTRNHHVNMERCSRYVLYMNKAIFGRFLACFYVVLFCGSLSFRFPERFHAAPVTAKASQ